LNGLKISHHFSSNEKQYQNQSHYVKVIAARSSDWFNAQFVPVVIGGSYYFGTGFSTALKTALTTIKGIRSKIPSVIPSLELVFKPTNHRDCKTTLAAGTKRGKRVQSFLARAVAK